MFGSILSFAGWYFLPNLATTYIQTFLYTLFIRAGDPKPQPGSPRHTSHRRTIHITVILLYLLYTLYETDHTLRQESDFYTLLSLPHATDDKTLQSRFRRLTVQFHPDKIPSAASAEQRADVERVYARLTLAKDTLSEHAKRFAYDRFGPEVLTWRGVSTVREYVVAGAQRTAAYYAASGAFLVLLNTLGYVEDGKFWRYWSLLAMFVVEMAVMTRPVFPGVLTGVVNPVLVRTGLREPYLPFQMVALLRRAVVTLFIALSQLGPLLKDVNRAAGDVDGKAVTGQQLDRIDALATATHQEMTRLFGLELAPFASETGSMQEVRATVKEWLVQNTVRNDPQVSTVINSSLEKRREGDVQGQVDS